MSVLSAIGNTSIVQLRKVVPPECARIFGKLEWENPTGSLKDRMAHAVIGLKYLSTDVYKGKRLQPV